MHRFLRRRSRARLPGLALVALAGVAWAGGLRAQAPDPGTPSPLRLQEVLEAVEGTYPPLLAALIERDIREGRLRTARSIYDLDLFGKLKSTPDGYYEYDEVEAGVEQFLGIWGTTVYGGYRLATGETLPDYYNDVRTQEDGEVALGVRIPLLRGGAIDDGRAAARRAELDVRGAEPFIARQRLDFIRAGSVAYYKWLAAGLKLRLARQLLAIAVEREAALEELVASGLQPDIVLLDNQRLVVDRELNAIEAERAFRSAALALSLFYRDAAGAPVTPGEEMLPQSFPEPGEADEPGWQEGVALAVERRPELQRLQLELQRLQVDRSLAGNGLLPNLDASVEAARSLGDELYSDIARNNLSLGLSFSLPVQRRSARGKVAETEGKLRQAQQDLAFVRQRIVADVETAWVALDAADRRTGRADLNVELAVALRDAEQERFRLGSSDLLAVQLREQSAFDAQSKRVEAFLDYFTALADYRAATARDVTPLPPPDGE